MKEVSRRSFLKEVVAVGGIAAAGSILGGCTADAAGGSPEASAGAITWDYEFDVVVPGTGGAGLATAITAADAGSSVVVIEKAPEKYMGGNSRVSMQAFWTPPDIDGAVEYVKEVAGDDHLYGQDDAYLKNFVTYSSTLPEWFASRISDMELVLHPSAEYKIAPHASASALSFSAEGQGFMRIWDALHDAALETSNITFMFETPLTNFIFDAEGACIGVVAEQDGKEINIKARQGVVLCTGGYENNPEMKANYLRHPGAVAVHFCGTPYNTGDGQNICMKHNIKMWHMNMCTQGCFTGIELPWVKEDEFKGLALSAEIAQDYGWIWLDKYGKRFMNELRGGQHGMARQDMFFFDGMKLEYPRMPFWFVFDAQALIDGKIGLYSSYDQWLSQIGGYTFTQDMEFEIEQGVCFKADTAQELAEKIGLDPEVLAETIATYNSYVPSGVDPEFGRVSGVGQAPPDQAPKGATMRVLNPPYYAMQQYPIMVNTQGGPQHDKNRQLMDVNENLIPRLYGAGECGSIWGWCYQGGANFGEAMASGRIAGEQVAALERWDA
jgi:succinate dehydrogenase/fumarate reductase flavoprotein subunit